MVMVGVGRVGGGDAGCRILWRGMCVCVCEGVGGGGGSGLLPDTGVSVVGEV